MSLSCHIQYRPLGGGGGGDTRFVAANTVCYETDTPDLARRER